jgi:hypothetical protein
LVSLRDFKFIPRIPKLRNAISASWEKSSLMHSTNENNSCFCTKSNLLYKHSLYGTRPHFPMSHQLFI